MGLLFGDEEPEPYGEVEATCDLYRHELELASGEELTLFAHGHFEVDGRLVFCTATTPILKSKVVQKAKYADSIEDRYTVERWSGFEIRAMGAAGFVDWEIEHETSHTATLEVPVWPTRAHGGAHYYKGYNSTDAHSVSSIPVDIEDNYTENWKRTERNGKSHWEFSN